MAAFAKPALQLYAYQKRWLADHARFKIGMMARQSGKTFTNTLELVDDVFANWTEGRRVRWVILSRGERQAREAMNEGVKRHAQAYGAALTDMDYEFEGGEGAKYKALEVAFPNDSRITALPANPDTARGFSANVLLDEFAFHQDSRAIWRALFPVISAGGKLRVVSRPNGKNNKFNERRGFDLVAAQRRHLSGRCGRAAAQHRRAARRHRRRRRVGAGVRAEVARRGPGLAALRSHCLVRARAGRRPRALRGQPGLHRQRHRGAQRSLGRVGR